MKLPFTIDQFLNNFAEYNQTVFPMQFILFALALWVVYLAIKNNKYSDKLISGVLAFFWLWIGIVYHITFFTNINKAAYIFGSFFIFQGLLFFIYGISKEKIKFSFQWDKYSKIGFIFILYALVIYPILGYFLGHSYPYNPTFGVPCPTTIFTFGLLLTASRPVSKMLLVIPLIWSFVGFSAALYLGIKEDIGLLVAGVVSTILIVTRKNN